MCTKTYPILIKLDHLVKGVINKTYHTLVSGTGITNGSTSNHTGGAGSEEIPNDRQCPICLEEVTVNGVCCNYGTIRHPSVFHVTCWKQAQNTNGLCPLDNIRTLTDYVRWII